MSRRAVVLVLGAVIAAAVAIPALADSGTTAKSASVKSLSVRALGRAKAALRTARSAKRSTHAAAVSARAAEAAAATTASAANLAKSSAAEAAKAAEGAQERAGGARLKAEEAQKELASTRPKIGFAEGEVSTESEAFVKLAGGPALTVDVPTSNLVQVWGSAVIEGAGTDEGAVSLYEDGHPAAGQAECDAQGVLFAAASPGQPLLVGTPATPGFAGCATLGAPGPVLFRSSTGEHSFELRYAACACSSPPAEEVTFSQRRLVVAPLP